MVADNSEELNLISGGYKNIAGVDETGMGSLACDVFVAAVILPPDIDYINLLKGLNDSKLKSPQQRDELYELIKEHALSYAVATASVDEIDIHNIYWARFIAARRAISSLDITPDYILMDGNALIPDIDIEQKAIVKGDSKSISIAAASILAKVDRDRYMLDLAKLVHDDYGWQTNKAYYSKKHVEALAKHGRTKWHREKFIRKFDVAGGK